MTTYWLKGEITPDRQLKVDLPSDIPAGTVQIAVLPEGEGVAATWTEAEVEAMLKPELQSNAEIVAWLQSEPTGWEDSPDGATWVEQQRLKAQLKRIEEEREHHR
jgi:hypothetical protein